MDIYRIATREGNEAHEAAETNEEKYDAYRKAYTGTLERGKRAQEILAAGGISRNGADGTYYVKSQNGGGTYTVDVWEETCTCPDHQHRGSYCKHLIAAELFECNTDPFAPDYEALGREPVRSEYLDSLDAAGYYTPGPHGISEEAWEYADICWASRCDRI